jgi:WD40 repeat protein
MFPALAQRVAAGQAPFERLEARVWRARVRRLAPSSRVEVVREGMQRGVVTRLDMDPVEDRYLLAAAGDGTVGLYDLAEGDANYGPARRMQAGGEGGGAPPPSQLQQGQGQGLPAPVRVRCLQATPRGSGGGGGVGGIGSVGADGAGVGVGAMGLVPRGPPAAALPGHAHAVTAVQWYPLDTGLFVSGSADGTVRVWDTNAFVSAGVFDLGAKVHLCVWAMV